LNRAISLSVIILGITAMASQIVFMREFLVVFCGNELSIGLILASWLIGGALGSSLSGVFADRMKHRIAAFCLCQLVLILALPLTVLAIRSVKTALGVSPGQIIPFFPMIAASLAILAPICIALGFMFALACGIYEKGSHLGAAGIGRIYIIETCGAVVGGFAASFILIQHLSSVHIAAFLSLLNAIAVFAVASSLERESYKPLFKALAAIAFAVCLLPWFSNGWDRIDKTSLENEWRGFDLVSSKNSIYGNITLAKKLEQFSFFDNGLHLYTVPDALAAEEAVHFAMLEHPRPKKVLLIGGGVGGLMEEALKYPVDSVCYVEIDPLIIGTAKDFLPIKYYKPLGDARAVIKNLDGRLFVKRAKEEFDCIILNVGDPSTAQLNRFYTAEFFAEIRRILKTGGVFSFSVNSSENYINDELKNFLESLYSTLRTVFANVIIVPGDTAYFIASDSSLSLTLDHKALAQRVRDRGLDLEYVRDYYLSSKLSPQRIAYVETSVMRENKSAINRDFRPIAYYYDIIYWSSRFKGSFFTGLLKSVTEETIWYAVFFVCLSIFALGFSSAKRPDFLEKASMVSVAATGFSAMAFQMLILLSFQIVYGYLFYKLGIIITSFMAGMVFGGWWIVKMLPRMKNHRLPLIITQTALFAYALVLPLSFLWLASSGTKVMYWSGSNIVFPALSAIAGVIGGFQFPLANAICLKKGKGTGRVAGLAYGTDLFGSCLGAVLTGAFLIPIIGIPKTCFLVAGLNLAVLLALVVSINVALFKKVVIGGIAAAGIVLGFHRICCLSVLDCVEDYIKYRKTPVDEVRFTINRDDKAFIDEIKRRVDPKEGVLVLHREIYFIAYYIYPIKMYKFRKGYFSTSAPYKFEEVDAKWLEKRNIKWVIMADKNERLTLKSIGEMGG